jgi:hypothetical protein
VRRGESGKRIHVQDVRENTEQQQTSADEGGPVAETVEDGGTSAPLSRTSRDGMPTRVFSWRHADSLLRLLWVLLTAGALVVLALGARPRVELLLAGCVEGVPCAPEVLDSEHQEAIRELGLSPRGVVWYLEILALLVVAACTGVGALLIWRQPRSLIAFVAATFLVYVASAASFNHTALADDPAFVLAVRVFETLTQTLIAALFLLFPSGRFVPRFTRWLLLSWVVYLGISALLPAPAWSWFAQPQAARQVSTVGVVLFGLAVQIYRYREVSDAVDRQRGKWALLALLVQAAFFVFAVILLQSAPRWSLGPLAEQGLRIVLYHGYMLTFLLIPVAICFSILRYRLWDIDLILHRSLTYGLLTAALAAVFAVSLVLLQALSRAIAGEQQQTLVVGASMLLAGAMFQPLRRRLRRLIDRGFFGIGLDYHGSDSGPSILRTPNHLEQSTALQGLGPLELVGRGGMAEVYRARDAHGRDVAVKVLRTSSEGGETIKRFEREAAIIAGFDHPNIVKLFDYRITSDGTRIMMMEYVPGLPLSAHVLESGMPLDQALDLLGDVCRALDYAHTRGVVHRDIKPANVLVETHEGSPPRWRAVLTDFGIAKVDATTQLTRSQLIGTVTHMSPEQIRDPAHVDHRSDIYSLGVLAFQLFTGQVPFDARGATAVLLAHLQQPAPDPRRLRSDLPDSVARAVLRALAKRPAARFATATEMLFALRAVGEGAETRAG